MADDRESAHASNGDLQARLSELVAENHRLRQQAADLQFVQAVRSAFSTASITGRIGEPVEQSRLLEMIVRAAASVLQAEAASILLLDEGTEELTFEVAIGEVADVVKQFRVPLGHGIAGLVAQSGEAIIANDAYNDPRHAVDIATRSGLLPRSLICIPLRLQERVIGVLEVLDRRGDTGFDVHDAEVLEVFGRQAAVAIEQSRMQHNLSALVAEVVRWIAASLAPEARANLTAAAGPFISGLEGDVEFRRALDLARLVSEIASRGDDDAALCQNLLRNLLRGVSEPTREISEPARARPEAV